MNGTKMRDEILNTADKIHRDIEIDFYYLRISW